MPSVAALSVYVYGLITIAAYLYNLYPIIVKFTLASPDLHPPSALLGAAGISFAPIVSAVYGLHSAWHDNRRILCATVAARFTVAFALGRYAASDAESRLEGVDGLGPWEAMAVWEGASAALTAVCLFWEAMGRWARNSRDAQKME